MRRAKKDTNIYETRWNLTGLSILEGLSMTFAKI